MKIQNMSEGGDGFRPSREEVNDFLRNQTLCEIATLDETGAPEVATVAFSVAHTGELIIGTSETSRKSQNIDNDTRVGLAVTDNERRITVQIKGVARKLAEAAFIADYAEEHYVHRPESLPFKDEPGQVHIAVTPQIIKFSDCNPHPWVVTEFIDTTTS